MKTITEGSNTLVNVVNSKDSPKDKQMPQGKHTVPQSKSNMSKCCIVGANMTHARGSYAQHLANSATGVINPIILQKSAITLQVEAQ